MAFLIIFAAIVSIISLVATLGALRKDPDPNYNMNKSFKNLSFIYLIIVPAILIVFGIIWFIL